MATTWLLWLAVLLVIIGVIMLIIGIIMWENEKNSGKTTMNGWTWFLIWGGVAIAVIGAILLLIHAFSRSSAIPETNKDK